MSPVQQLPISPPMMRRSFNQQQQHFPQPMFEQQRSCGPMSLRARVPVAYDLGTGASPPPDAMDSDQEFGQVSGVPFL